MGDITLHWRSDWVVVYYRGRAIGHAESRPVLGARTRDGALTDTYWRASSVDDGRCTSEHARLADAIGELVARTGRGG